jgi:ferredoxin-like protein FixX
MARRVEIKVDHPVSAKRLYDSDERKEMLRGELLNSCPSVVLSVPAHGHESMTINCLECGVPAVVELKSLRYRLLVLGVACLAFALAAIPLLICEIAGITSPAALGPSFLVGIAGFVVFLYGLAQLVIGINVVKAPAAHIIETIPSGARQSASPGRRRRIGP